MKKFSFLDLSKELLPCGRDQEQTSSQDDRHNINWRAILKQSAELVYDQGTAKGAKSFKRLDHDPFPANGIQRKMDFFYLPYSCEQNVCKHMSIPEGGSLKPEEDSKWEGMRNFIYGLEPEKQRRIYELMWKYKGMEPTAEEAIAYKEASKSPKKLQSPEPAG